MDVNYDFCGWVTKNNLRCSDNRIIDANAFAHCDGKEVPLVWNHNHNSIDNVLGLVLLENRDEGVYGYGSFNNSESGIAAKERVMHGDITSMSIFANQLREHGNPSHVVHGNIREVSLVLAGANPGAVIEDVILHDDDDDYAAIIYTGLEGLKHADEGENMANENAATEETIGDVLDTLTDKQRSVVYALIEQALSEGSAKHSDESDEDVLEHSDVYEEEDVLEHADDSEETVGDVFDTLNDKQKQVVYALIGMIMEDNNMAHNMFENNYGATGEDDVLVHSEFLNDVVSDAKRFGSMKDSFLAHAAEYGIDNLEFLFPEDHVLDPTPQFIKRETGWVSVVMNGVHHSPFSRIKSRFADITEDEARAKGYIKGNLKKEEVFSLLKRSTAPTTIYKKQKMDRDDVIDITDFDVITWIKAEMRGMLDEEIARAILIGDGRLSSDDDKIDENCIRPVLTDSDLFVIRWGVANGSSADEKAKNFIRACIKSRKNYKGSGNPILFTTEDMLTDMLLIEDTQGYRIYKTEAELATALRVSRIVTVPVMEGLEVSVSGSNKDVHGIILNLADYNVGADKGGAINMFDDFDIDYNQLKYLIETRCSGALTKPFSAIVLRENSTTASLEPTLAEAKAQLA